MGSLSSKSSPSPFRSGFWHVATINGHSTVYNAFFSTVALWGSKVLWLLFCRETPESQRLLFYCLWTQAQAWCQAQIHVSSQQTGLNDQASCSIRHGRKCGIVLLLNTFVHLPCVLAYCGLRVYICTKLCHPASLEVINVAGMGKLATGFFLGDQIFLTERPWNSFMRKGGLLWEELCYDVPELQAT